MKIYPQFAARLMLLSLVLTGCAAEQESLHEHDHHEPAHWPQHMLHAADLIHERLAALQLESGMPAPQRQQAVAELTDLVEWAPEIAADTDLSEADWLPIYELSETMRRHLQDPQVDPLDLTSDFEKLEKQLRQHGESVAAQQPAADSPDAALPASNPQASSL